MAEPKPPAAPAEGFIEEGAAAPKADKKAEDKTLSTEPMTGGVLTQADVERIRAEAKRQVLADKKASAEKQFLAHEKSRLAREEGLTTGLGPKDEMVRFTVDLAEYAANVLLNGRPYWHGQTYTVPRHVAETLRELCQATHRHQNQVDGKDSKHFYQKARNTELSPVGATNAPVSPGADRR